MTNRLFMLSAVLVLAACANRGFYAHAPIASAALVHSCALAEVDFQFQKAGGALERKLEIEMSAGGEAGPSAEIDISGIAPGYEARASSTKTLSFKVENIPSLEACLKWGYVPQLGIDGCVPKKHGFVLCAAASPADLLTELRDEKAVRLKAASDLSCAASAIQVNVIAFTQGRGTYQATGCGMTAQYAVNDTAVAPVDPAQPRPGVARRAATMAGTAIAVDGE